MSSGQFRFAYFTPRYEETIAFYRNGLGLPVVEAWDRSPDDRGTIFGAASGLIEVAALPQGDESDHLFDARPPQGAFIVLEVDDVAAFFQRVKQKDLDIQQSLKDQDWGHRNFCIREPNGLTIYVFSEIGTRRAPTRADTRVNIRAYTGDRLALMPLFVLADDSHRQISQYISQGEVLVAWDEDEIVGHTQVVATDDVELLELKSLAVLESRQREGVGSALVQAAIAHGRERGAHQLTVSTATADIGNLAFYQKLGFRMSRVVPDAFTPAKGYPAGTMVNGIPLRDQVFLKLKIF